MLPNCSLDTFETTVMGLQSSSYQTVAVHLQKHRIHFNWFKPSSKCNLVVAVRMGQVYITQTYNIASHLWDLSVSHFQRYPRKECHYNRNQEVYIAFKEPGLIIFIRIICNNQCLALRNCITPHKIRNVISIQQLPSITSLSFMISWYISSSSGAN